MRIFRGDTFEFDFSATLEDRITLHTFETGDVLKAGIKRKIQNTDYMLYQSKTIEENTDTVRFEFSHEEMMLVSIGEAVLEVELTSAGRVSTLYQEEIEIEGDVIDE